MRKNPASTRAACSRRCEVNAGAVRRWCSPRHWEDPERFDPERFSKANEKLHVPFTWLPFGAGPRGCIGGNYATLQLFMILSVLLRKYELQLVPGQTIEARPMVILRPKHGIRMNFTEAITPSPAPRLMPF